MATKAVKTTTRSEAKIPRTPAGQSKTPKKAAAVKKTASSSRKRGSTQIDSHVRGNDNVLDPRIFAYPIKEALLIQVLHIYRDNLHQNTSKVKTRGELERTTKKMFKQKGTGNARHGSRMAPQFVGGGIAHGPTGVKPANLKINQKMKAAALAGILSQYAAAKHVELITPAGIKDHQVKTAQTLLPQVKTLLVHFQEAPLFTSSVRNLGNVDLIEANRLNAYLVAQSKHIALTPTAHESLVNRLLPLLKAKK